MLQKLQKTILISMILHGILLSSLYYSKENFPSTNKKNFEVILNDTRIKTDKTPSRKKVQKARSKKKTSLSDFKPEPFALKSYSEKSLSKDLHEGSYSEVEGDVNETMNQMSLQEYSGNRLFFELLKAKVDRTIQYPQELVEHNIQGNNWINLIVNHKGELVRIIDASANHPTLKAFTIFGSYQALKKPLPKKYWYQPQRNITLQFHFDFRIYTFGNQQSRATSSYHKNRFEFLRVQNGKNIVEKFVTDNARYIPPILPLPGGFFLNFAQVYQTIKAWNELDPKIRRRQRLEMTKERLDRMMKSAKKEHSNQ